MSPEAAVTTWPTRAGWVAVGMAFALAEAGALGGNNLVIAVAVIGWAVLLVDYGAGRRNLAGVELAWQLPEELFAGRGARGAFRVRSPDHTAHELFVTDGVASAEAPVVEAGAELTLAAWWRPQHRGELVLAGLSVRSVFPFGLFLHQCTVDRQARCTVYPAPRFDPAWEGLQGAGEGDCGTKIGGAGDLLDLRAYRVGDRLRSLHWRTSARFGRWMVVDRAREEQEGVRVRVDPDAGLERELQAAAGAILEATGNGATVSLELPGHPELERFGTGTRWRRQLLDALATYGDPG